METLSYRDLILSKQQIYIHAYWLRSTLLYMYIYVHICVYMCVDVYTCDIYMATNGHLQSSVAHPLSAPQ